MNKKLKENWISYLKIAGGISMTSPLVYGFFHLENFKHPLATTIYVYAVLIGIGIGMFNYLES